MSPEIEAASKALVDALEPAATARYPLDLAVHASIAVSLKRIADALTTAGLGLTTVGPGLAADVSNMVATMAYEAGRNFEGGRRNG